MKKKLSCGLLALTMAFSSTPALFDGNFASVGVVDVEAGGAEIYPLKLTVTGAEQDSIKIYAPTYGYVVPADANSYDNNVFTFNNRSQTDYVISYTSTSGVTLFYKDVISLDNEDNSVFNSTDQTFEITIDGTSGFTKHLVTYQRGTTLLTKNFELVDPFDGTTARTLTMPDYTDPDNEEYYISGWYTSVVDDNGAYTKTDYTDGTTVLTANTGYVTLMSDIMLKSNTDYSGETITFNIDGTTSTETTNTNGNVTFPSNPTKDASNSATYTFKEWNTKFDGSGTLVTSSTVFKEATTIYAIFETTPNTTLPNLPTPTIEGTAKVGETLSVTVADVDLDGYAIQWYADGEKITGATSSTLTLAHAQLGSKITVGVTAPANSEVYNSTESVSSATTGVIAKYTITFTGADPETATTNDDATVSSLPTLEDKTEDGKNTRSYIGLTKTVIK